MAKIFFGKVIFSMACPSLSDVTCIELFFNNLVPSKLCMIRLDRLFLLLNEYALRVPRGEMTTGTPCIMAIQQDNTETRFHQAWIWITSKLFPCNHNLLNNAGEKWV